MLSNKTLKYLEKGQQTQEGLRTKERDDDVVVFKNCAKSDGSYDEKRIAQFVNDSLCSDFHRRFTSK